MLFALLRELFFYTFASEAHFAFQYVDVDDCHTNSREAGLWPTFWLLAALFSQMWLLESG